MTPQDYALSIKEKFGDTFTHDGQRIADLEEKELIRRMITKYPAERAKIQGLDAYLGENLSKEELKKIPPKTTVMEQLEKIAGFFPGRTLGRAVGTAIVGAGQLAKGDMQGFQDTVADQVSVPQQIGDVTAGALTALSAGAAPPASALGKIGAGAALGGAISGARSLAEGQDAGDVVKATGFGAAAGAAFPAVAEGIKGFGKLIQGAGDKIQFSVIKPTQADMSDGFSLDTVKKYNLGGSLTESFRKTETLMDDLTGQLNAKISEGVPLDLQAVYKETADDLLANKARSFGSNSNIENVLGQLKGEVDSVGGTVDLKDGQTIKRAAGHLGAWQFGMRDPESTARERVYNVFYSKLKEAIEKASPEGVKEINKQISELIPVMNAIIRRIPIAQRNNALGLGEIMSLVGSTVDPKALGIGMLNLASKSGAVGNALSKAGEQISKGVPEVIGQAGRTLIPQTTIPRD